MGFTRFYRVLPGFTGFYQVLLGFTEFYLVFTRFYWVEPGFTGFYWVEPGFTGFYWVLPRCAALEWVLLGFTGFYRVLPGFTGFYESPVVVGGRKHFVAGARCNARGHGLLVAAIQQQLPERRFSFSLSSPFFSCCCLSSFLFVFFLVCLLFCSLSLSLSLVALFYCPVRSSSLLSSDLRFLFAPPSLFYRVFTEFSFVDFVFVSCSTKLVEPPRVLAACVGWKQVLPSFYRVFFRAARIIL